MRQWIPDKQAANITSLPLTAAAGQCEDSRERAQVFRGLQGLKNRVDCFLARWGFNLYAKSALTDRRVPFLGVNAVKGTL